MDYEMTQEDKRDLIEVFRLARRMAGDMGDGAIGAIQNKLLDKKE